MPEPLFKPIRIVDVDLDGPLPDLAAMGRFGGVFCLVRKAGRPVAVAEFPVSEDTCRSDRLLREICRAVNIGSIPPRQPRPAMRLRPATVVIATRDRADSLQRCLESILEQDHPDFDVIVVDNAPSTDETERLVAERYASTGKIRYVREPRPGLGRAHNAGLAHVSAPVVAFTDDDVIADRRWLSALASNFAEDGSVGCVTGLILPAELDTRAQLWTERHGGFGKGFERRVYDLHANRPAASLFPYTAGQFGSGASMAFATGIMSKLGGFDAALGAGTLARGGDDLAAFYCIVQCGHQLVYEPESVVWHHHRRGEDGMERQAFGYGMGLGAYLTKVVLDRPKAALDLALGLPAGLSHMFGAASPKNRRLPADYPQQLVWRERLGILNGVLGYLRSRHALRTESPRDGVAVQTWVR